MPFLAATTRYGIRLPSLARQLSASRRPQDYVFNQKFSSRIAAGTADKSAQSVCRNVIDARPIRDGGDGNVFDHSVPCLHFNDTYTAAAACSAVSSSPNIESQGGFPLHR